MRTFPFHSLHRVKLPFSLSLTAALLALTVLPASAQTVVYDDFDSPIGPDVTLWTVSSLHPGKATHSGSILTMSSSSGNVGLRSTAAFGYGVFAFNFSGSANTSYRGFGIESDGGDRILLRDDTVAGSLRLDVLTNGVSVIHPGAATTDFAYGPDDTWEFHYAAAHLMLVRNGVTVFDESLTLTADPVKITMFAYSGGSMSLDSVNVTPAAVPEPSTYALCAGALVLVVGVGRRWVGRRR